MKKMVVMMDVYDDISKKRILKTVASCPGVTTITMDSTEGKLTVIGEAFDIMKILAKLKQRWRNARMVTFGPYDPKKEAETAAAAATVAANKKKEENEHQIQSLYCPTQHHFVSVCDHDPYQGCIIS